MSPVRLARERYSRTDGSRMGDRRTDDRFWHWRSRGCRYNCRRMPRKPIDGPHFIAHSDVLIAEKQLKYDRRGDGHVANHDCKNVEDVSHFTPSKSPCFLFRD